MSKKVDKFGVVTKSMVATAMLASTFTPVLSVSADELPGDEKSEKEVTTIPDVQVEGTSTEDTNKLETDVSKEGEVVEPVTEETDDEATVNEVETILEDEVVEDEESYDMDEESANIVYDYVKQEDGTIKITKMKYRNYTNYTVPDKIGGVKVTAIGDSVFYNKSLKGTLTLPKWLVTLGGSAFEYNKLTSVVLPDTLETIGRSAFEDNTITELVIPESVTKIGSYAFRYNNIGGDLIIPGSIKVVEDSSFKGNKIERVFLEEGVVELEQTAFNGQYIKEWHIANTVKYIDERMDYWQNEADVIVYGEYSTYAETYANSLGAKFVPTKPIYEYEENEEGNLTLTKYLGTDVNVKVPSELENKKVIAVGSNAFADVTLNNIEFPKTGIEIADNALGEDKGVNESVTVRGGAKAKEYAEKFGHVYIDDSYDGEDLTDMSGAEAAKSYEYVELTDGTIQITKYKDNNRNIVIPDKISGRVVTSIKEKAFEDKYINSVVLPKKLKEVGDYAFYNDFYLEKVTLPDTLEIIGEYSFARNSIKEIKLPSALKTMGKGAFSKNSLESVTFGEGLTILEEEVFSNNALTDLNIPSTVTVIGKKAYENNNIEGLFIPGTVEVVGEESFNRNRLEFVLLNEGVKEIKQGAFNGNNLLREVFLPKTIENIETIEYNVPEGAKLKVYGNEGTYAETYNPDGVEVEFIIDSMSDYNLVQLKGNKVRINKYNGTDSGEIVIPAELRKNKVTELAKDAYKDVELTRVELPSGITKMEDSVFGEDSGVNKKLYFFGGNEVVRQYAEDYGHEFEEYPYADNEELDGKAPSEQLLEWFPEGVGSTANPFLVNSREQLEKIGEDDALGFKFKLGNDIDLSGEEWTPIPEFYGELDGGIYTIDGLNIKTKTTYWGTGLIANVPRDRGLSLKNIKMTNVDIDVDADNVGALLGKFDLMSYEKQRELKLENIEIQGKVKGKTNVGLVAGFADVKNVKGIKVTGEIEGNEGVGGVFGRAKRREDTLIIQDVELDVKVNGDNRTGGITGYIQAQDKNGDMGTGKGKTEIKNVSGKVTSEVGTDSGGLVGYVYNSGDFKTHGIDIDFTAKPKDKDSGIANLGGLVGYTDNGKAKVSAKKVNINLNVTTEDSGARTLGGLFGKISSGNIDLDIEGNTVNGLIDIKSASGDGTSGAIGGVLGDFYYSEDGNYTSVIDNTVGLDISFDLQNGSGSSFEGGVGGVVGNSYTNGDVTIEDNTMTGDILINLGKGYSPSMTMGGISGRIQVWENDKIDFNRNKFLGNMIVNKTVEEGDSFNTSMGGVAGVLDSKFLQLEDNSHTGDVLFNGYKDAYGEIGGLYGELGGSNAVEVANIIRNFSKGDTGMKNKNNLEGYDENQVGGILGGIRLMETTQITIEDTFKDGNLFGDSYVGGIIGYLPAYSEGNNLFVKNVYFRGEGQAYPYGYKEGKVRGLIGDNALTHLNVDDTFLFLENIDSEGNYRLLKDEYYDAHDVINNLYTLDTYQNVEEGLDVNRVTVDERKQKETYENAGWDFTKVWKMVEGEELPQLQDRKREGIINESPAITATLEGVDSEGRAEDGVSINYQVTDNENHVVDVMFKLNGEEISRETNIEKGIENTFSLRKKYWRELPLNEEATVEMVVTDELGATRKKVFKFTKIETFPMTPIEPSIPLPTPINPTPVIEGQVTGVTDSGKAYKGVGLEFNVTHADNVNVDVEVSLDGLPVTFAVKEKAEVRIAQAIQSGADYVVTVTDEQFEGLESGKQHTLVVKAVDERGAVVTKAFSFVKGNSIPATPIEPIEPPKVEIPWIPIEPSLPIEPPKVEIPWTPIEPSIPVEPDEDVEIPWTPIEPSIPVEPDEGVEIPWTPIEPSTPVEPDEDVEIPWTPIEPGLPIEPPKVEIPWIPVEPSNPVEKPDEDVEIPWTPIEPATPVEPEVDTDEEVDELPATPIEPSKPVEPDSDVNEVPLTPIEPSTPVVEQGNPGVDSTKDEVVQNDTSKKETEKLPQTNEKIQYGFGIGALLLALGLFGIRRRKDEKVEKK